MVAEMVRVYVPLIVFVGPMLGGAVGAAATQHAASPQWGGDATRCIDGVSVDGDAVGFVGERDGDCVGDDDGARDIV
eukprot:gene17423-13482_t